MASEPNDLDQYVAYVRAELNKGKYTAFEFMSRERLREILDALTEARAALAVQARTHVVETPVLVQASRRTAYQPQGTPGAPAVTDEELTQLAERLARGYTMSMYATQGDMLLDREGDRKAASSAILSLMRERDELALQAQTEWDNAHKANARATLAESRLARAVEGLKDILATLVATTALVIRAEDAKKQPSKVVASNTMFHQMLVDYDNATIRARSILSEITEAKGSDATGAQKDAVRDE